MPNRKCAQCALVNFATDDVCRRCRAPLSAPGHSDDVDATPSDPATRLSLTRVCIVVVALLVTWWASLVTTSDGLDVPQQALVARAVAVLDRAGFGTNAMVLRRVAMFRSTDNWWNAYNGHVDAYAATNWPFGVVTLYPHFFSVATDDVERAVILLHESRHLLGHGETDALETVWCAKGTLGWTEERYGETRVWANTLEWTQAALPHLFDEGGDAGAPCTT